jgi:hypothetical protein
MSTLSRSICLVAFFAFAGCVTSWDSGYRPTTEETLDIFTAVLKSRLARTPLPHQRNLYVFLNEGIVPGLAARFRDYHVILRSGSPGSLPPHARWYYLHMGRYTPDKAYVTVDAVEWSGHIVELRKREGTWSVVDDREIIII